MSKKQKNSGFDIFIVPKLLIFLVLFLGIGMLVQGVKEHIELKNRTVGYESVEGYLIDTGIYSQAHGTGRHHHAATYYLVYEYHVDGVRYTVKTNYGTGTIPPQGSAKTIHYDPHTPSKAVISGTNGPSILIVAGLMFTLVPLVMILAVLANTGALGKPTFNIMDIVMGLVLLVIGGGFIYLMAGTFSPLVLFAVAGPFALIPLMLAVVGLLLVGRGLLGKQKA